MSQTPLHLFDAFGVELEYAIVRRDSLDVAPICDKLMEAAAGATTSEYEAGAMAWSNELALHVVEFKTNGPAESLVGLARQFQDQVDHAGRLLGAMGARLMPTAMHPWMDPHTEMVLWPHEYTEIYRTYDRIFDCRGHGWANLQSCHINLPFCGDEEFGRLHAAIRLVLPLLPALAASSPYAEGRRTPFLDTRLHYYRGNQERVPSIAGMVIPEPVYTEAEYRRAVYDRVRADIMPLDPEGVLKAEFLNSRGAIARFDRGAIEIRLLDLQECPAADLAVVALVVGAVRLLAGETYTPLAEQQPVATEQLAALLDATIRDADAAMIIDEVVLRQFGMGPKPRRAGEVWQSVAERLGDGLADNGTAARALLERGPLARAISAAAGDGGRQRLTAVYTELCDCLVAGRLFRAG
jgi:gamma-glutamyl:cysteine ligase YbdK (ATP-grasp superfamily)